MGERMWRDGPRLMTERALLSDGAGGTVAASGSASGSEKRAGTGSRSVTVHVGESPLSWLRSRGMVSARQHDAGDMLRADWEEAGLSPRVTMRWEARGSTGTGQRGAPDGGSETLRQIDAKRRFDAATAAVGPGLSDVLWRVVCAGEGLAAAEKALGWPARAGKLVLGLALDRLADHYRLR
jgi:hypothetical protein